MNKVLLVGSSFSAAPILFALKNKGLHVSVVGKHETDPCHYYSDASYYLDYSVVDDLRDLLRSEKFDYLVPSCNDYSYMSCAALASEFGYPGFDSFETSRVLHTKNEFRKLSATGLFPAPKIWKMSGDAQLDVDEVRFPVLVKPTDSFSGIGVSKIYKSEDIDAAIIKASSCSRNKEYVIEEFVEGSLHSHSAFISNGEIVIDFVVDEFCSVYPYQVDCSNCPTLLKTEIITSIRTAVENIINDMKLADGLLHTQFMTDGQRIWIVECMRRCPGDLYGNLISRSTGYDYLNAYVGPFIGEIIQPYDMPNNIACCGRHTISLPEKAAFYSLSFDFPASNVEYVPLKQSGDLVDAAPYDKIGIAFLDYMDSVDMEDITQRLSEYVQVTKYRVTPGE